MSKLLVFKKQNESEIEKSFLIRKIIHVDMDAFFAAIEVLDNPDLANKPLVVGGPPKTRSVVSTANYIARKFGINSAMPIDLAVKLCPEITIVKPRFKRYLEISKKLSSIIKEFSIVFEKPSLDEAYLDVTKNKLNLNATSVAKLIQKKIASELNLTCSLGVAPNKLVAKIATDFNKPNGITVILPAAVKIFMQNLPINKIPGVGKVTYKQLAELHIKTCQNLLDCPLEDLSAKIGSRAFYLKKAAQGINNSPVENYTESKSCSTETTFPHDITSKEEIYKELRNISEKLSQTIIKKKIRAKTLTLKLRQNNFKTYGFSISNSEVLNPDNLYKTATQLFEDKAPKSIPIRLLGLKISNFITSESPQYNKKLTLF